MTTISKEQLKTLKPGDDLLLGLQEKDDVLYYFAKFLTSQERQIPELKSVKIKDIKYLIFLGVEELSTQIDLNNTVLLKVMFGPPSGIVHIASDTITAFIIVDSSFSMRK